MKALRPSPVALLLTTLGAAAACTFSADDFKIVDAGASDSGGDDGTGDVSSGGTAAHGGKSGNGGTPSSGGTSDNGGSVGTTGGDNSAGMMDEGGAGAGPVLPSYLCAPQDEPFTIFGPADHQLRSIDQVTVASSNDGVVVIAAGPSMPQQNVTRLVYRTVRDSNGGTPDGMGSFEAPGSRIKIDASLITIKHELRMTGLDGGGVFEYAVGIPLNGSAFPQGTRSDLDGQEYCTKNQQGGLRDLKADYSASGLGYAFTCNIGQDGDPNTTYQLYLKEPGPGSPQLLRGPSDKDAIIRRYIRIGQQNFLLVGNEVGPTVGVRYGELGSLDTVHTMGLSSNPNIFSAFQANLFPSGLFLTGAAFTTDGDNPPPLVPASIFSGEVDPTEIGTLFAATPPRPLNQVLSYTKASQLVGIDDSMAVGQNRLGVGVHIATKDRISATLVTKKGELLAGPTELYKTGGAQIADNSVNVVPLGLGALVVWAESSTVKGRLFACLQD